MAENKYIETTLKVEESLVQLAKKASKVEFDSIQSITITSNGVDITLIKGEDAYAQHLPLSALKKLSF